MLKVYHPWHHIWKISQEIPLAIQNLRKQGKADPVYIYIYLGLEAWAVTLQVSGA